MDLGRPVARHLIRRPQEAIELEEISTDTGVEEEILDEQPVGSETPEH